MRNPKIITSQPGYTHKGKYQVMATTSRGYRLFHWIRDKWGKTYRVGYYYWMDASLQDVPELKKYADQTFYRNY